MMLEKGGDPMPDRRHLALIHIAKSELNLDDATYRGVLWDRYGKESAAQLTDREADDLVELFRQKGWRPASFRQLGLIHVLWRRIEAAGGLDHPGERALASFLEHATGKDDLRRLTVHEASRVIEMLKRWIERLRGEDRRH
jgi:phage gp16-like protein